MLTGVIIYHGKKPDVSEVQELMPFLDITFVEYKGELKTFSNGSYLQLDWAWLKTLAPNIYDLRCFVSSPAEFKKVGITNHWGLYNLDSDKTHDFYIAQIGNVWEERAKKNGFRTNFGWLFCHEFLHGSIWETHRVAKDADLWVHQWEAEGTLKAHLADYTKKYAALTTTVGLLKTWLSMLLATPKKSKGEELYDFAVKYLGTDASPADLADDVVGCAETVTTILKSYMGFPVILGTATLYSNLEQNPKFKRTTSPMPGDIILSPTGMGNGKIQGHVGFVGKNGQVLSNDSYTGKFSANFTLATWNARYKDKGGLPVYFYQIV